MNVISNRYCEAMFQLAIEEKIVKESYDSLKVVAEVIAANQDLQEVLSHPEIRMEEKLSLAKETFKDIDKTTLNFLLVIIEKGRINYIQTVFEEYEYMFNVYYKIQAVKVYSVIPLNEEQVLKLEKNLEKRLQKQVRIKNIIDKTIIGGIKIVVDNHIIDSSIQAKIKDLSRQLYDIQII